jgi:hypothetical protein
MLKIMVPSFVRLFITSSQKAADKNREGMVLSINRSMMTMPAFSSLPDK